MPANPQAEKATTHKHEPTSPCKGCQRVQGEQENCRVVQPEKQEGPSGPTTPSTAGNRW